MLAEKFDIVGSGSATFGRVYIFLGGKPPGQVSTSVQHHFSNQVLYCFTAPLGGRRLPSGSFSTGVIVGVVRPKGSGTRDRKLD